MRTLTALACLPEVVFLGVIAQAQSTRGAVRVGDLLFAGLRAGPGRKAGALRRGCHVRQRGQVSVGAKWLLWNLGRGGLGRWRLRSQASRRVVPEGTLGGWRNEGWGTQSIARDWVQKDSCSSVQRGSVKKVSFSKLRLSWVLCFLLGIFRWC